MPKSKAAGLTRRQVLKAGAATTFAGYAVGVEKALGQAIKTTPRGSWPATRKSPSAATRCRCTRPGRPTPPTRRSSSLISEIWGVHEWVKDVTRRFAKDGYYAVAPELFKREGGVGHLPNVPDILKIVLAVPRKQVLGDVAAAVDWTKKRPGARADRVGVTGHCWGGSTVYQVAATNPDIRGAVAWYGPPARPYPTRRTR